MRDVSLWSGLRACARGGVCSRDVCVCDVSACNELNATLDTAHVSVNKERYHAAKDDAPPVDHVRAYNNAAHDVCHVKPTDVEST